MNENDNLTKPISYISKVRKDGGNIRIINIPSLIIELLRVDSGDIIRVKLDCLYSKNNIIPLPELNDLYALVRISGNSLCIGIPHTFLKSCGVEVGDIFQIHIIQILRDDDE